MRITIIDDKGRLFGKINVIDFLVILFIVCLVWPMPIFFKRAHDIKIKNEQQILAERQKEAYMQEARNFADEYARELQIAGLNKKANDWEQKYRNEVTLHNAEIAKCTEEWTQRYNEKKDKYRGPKR